MQSRFGRINPHLLIALAIGLGFHGGLLFFTFKRTYDAYVHIFFADHYARAWFDHWEYRWYTGFTMTSYPPGSHQTIALLSRLIGLQNGFIIVQAAALLLLIIGVYRFSRIWVSERAAGYATLFAVFSSSITETLHLFGQLPTTFSLSFLLNALPFVYAWLRNGQLRRLLMAWALNAATTAGHHVTTLFGAVFFVAPVIALALAEALITPDAREQPPNPPALTRRTIRPLAARYLRRILPGVGRAAIYGPGLIAILVLVVLPYWLWSRADPIVQVPIPHASRDSFIHNTAAGLVFWLIPWGVPLLLLPWLFYKGLTTRAWPITLSLALLFVLGTGGTTPVPRWLLRGAFDILTLDRFTFWATILALPLLGAFAETLWHGRLRRLLHEQFGRLAPLTVQATLVSAFVVTAIFTANLSQFRTFQPEPIDMQPIVTFIEKDQHWRWRYLTLGFGDQMAWLSAQTTATSVDGNYHSARRLPELTSTPVERLEGAKFRGLPGLGSLQQFLAVPEKYHLKFIFSNDEFYDPLLFFSGWHQINRLENGIVVWEREDIPPLPDLLPRREIPLIQRLMWGVLPPTGLLAGVLALLLHATGLHLPAWRRRPARAAPQPRRPGYLARLLERWCEWPAGEPVSGTAWQPDFGRFFRPRLPKPPRLRLRPWHLLLVALGTVALARTLWVNLPRQVNTPEAVVIAYYDDLDFRRHDDAYARLDPQQRPPIEQFLLELSVRGGLLPSYAKLDHVHVEIIGREDETLYAAAHTSWITALERYETTQEHRLVQHNGRWVIVPESADITIPPNPFVRRPGVSWRQQERRRVTPTTTGFADVQDRPKLEIRSARLVLHAGQLTVVGELVNSDVDPADVTVTALLFDADDVPISWYNAQTVIMHKLLPREMTPFRIDFEGVAGATVAGAEPADFDPAAFTPIDSDRPVARFELYAKAVVTGRDLYREVGVQQVRWEAGELHGELFNAGTQEAIIPQLLLTLYDDRGHVAWVDRLFMPWSIRPHRSEPFRLPLSQATALTVVLDQGDLYSNLLDARSYPDDPAVGRLALPPESGYAAVRFSINNFMGAAP